MQIERDDLTRPQVLALLAEHLRDMDLQSPPGSNHALDPQRLSQPDISFWTAWDGPVLLGCGALKELDPRHGELKSMRTPSALRGRGVGRALLRHLMAVAATRGYARLSLETGADPAFAPAIRLYESEGFVRCAPFAGYTDDPHSVFMTQALPAREV